MASEKTKKAFKMVMNGATKKDAMIASGFSPASANSNQLSKRKGWNELIEKHLPDTLLVSRHKDGLSATNTRLQIVDRDKNGKPVFEKVVEKDFNVRHKYLETAYKLKGRFPKEADEGNIINILNIFSNGRKQQIAGRIARRVQPSDSASTEQSD